MIAYLKGPVLQLETQAVILNAGGVGYRIFVPTPILDRAQAESELELYIHYHFNDSGPSLYGFERPDQLAFFQDLLTVSGVGPKIGLAILSQAPMDETKRAILHGDASLLQRVSGVGKKTGERIVVELKNKVTVSTEGQTTSTVIGGFGGDDALDALVALGFSRGEAIQALHGLDSSLPASERVKLALKQTGRSV
ncbi:MAG: Holliday junction branch migration protein RuvA [Patescibacteria group bacterium]